MSLFAWRLLQDRIPTRSNLVRQHVLQSIDNVCVSGCGSAETTDHLFRGCDLFGSASYLVCQWLGVPSVFPGSDTYHYFQFIHLAGLPQCTHSYLKVIWLACSWANWKERNNCVFKNVVLDPFSIVDKVKLTSFLWLSSHLVPIAFGFHDWVEILTSLYGCHVIFFLYIFGGGIHVRCLWVCNRLWVIHDHFSTPCAGGITLPLSNRFHFDLFKKKLWLIIIEA